MLLPQLYLMMGWRQNQEIACQDSFVTVSIIISSLLSKSLELWENQNHTSSLLLFENHLNCERHNNDNNDNDNDDDGLLCVYYYVMNIEFYVAEYSSLEMNSISTFVTTHDALIMMIIL
jgi:hypothetical protein